MYDVLLNGSAIGYAKVDREGLYYKFQCNCKFYDHKIYRIKVSDGVTEIQLGICVPEGDRFTLHTKIPIKRLQKGGLLFTAEVQHEKKIIIEREREANELLKKTAEDKDNPILFGNRAGEYFDQLTIK